jgi:hypothetical protein
MECLNLLFFRFSWLCLPSAFMLISRLTYSSTLKMKATCSSETSVDFQRTTRCYISQDIHMEAGSNTSTVTLRVVGDYEKGSLKSETVKYGRETHGTRTRERLRWRGPSAYTKDRLILSSERTPLKNKTVTVKQ